MQSVPQTEHQWLQQLLGEWNYETQCIMGPDQPPMTMKGTETVRSLGGLWTVGEGKNDHGTSIMTLGYDEKQKRFVGTFIASMMSHLWTYNGTLDESGKILTLDAEGPSFTATKGLAKYQDIIEIVDANTRILRSQILTPEGEWKHFMTGHYHRAGTQPFTAPKAQESVTSYLFFGGRCEEAVNFYHKALGAQVEAMMRFDQAPDPTPEGMLQPGFEKKIMHASFVVGATRVMASDGCDSNTKIGGFSLALSYPTQEEAHRAFNALAEGGQVTMPLGPTFWSPCYGMLTDPFGVNWMVMVHG